MKRTLLTLMALMAASPLIAQDTTKPAAGKGTTASVQEKGEKPRRITWLDRYRRGVVGSTSTRAAQVSERGVFITPHKGYP